MAAYVGGDEALARELRASCKEFMRRYEHLHLHQFVNELSPMVTGKAHRYRLHDLAEALALA